MNHPELRRYIRHGTLVQLSVFDMVARLASFTRAAQSLHMAQPTVSMHIKKLTEVVGLPLFAQQGRSIQLTDAGRELQAACQDIFEKIVAVEARLAKMRAPIASRLRLGVSTTGKYFAPRLLTGFWEAHPGIDVALNLLNRQQLLHRLESDLDDFYIVSNPPEDDDIASHPLLPNRLCVYARDDHPLARTKGIPIVRLATESFLVREPGSGTRMAVDELFAEHGIEPTVRMELGSNEAIKQSILAGIGIAILSHHSMASETRQGHIVALDVEGTPIERMWHLVHRKSRPLAAAARSFLAHATQADVLRELQADSH